MSALHNAAADWLEVGAGWDRICVQVAGRAGWICFKSGEFKGRLIATKAKVRGVPSFAIVDNLPAAGAMPGVDVRGEIVPRPTGG